MSETLVYHCLRIRARRKSCNDGLGALDFYHGKRGAIRKSAESRISRHAADVRHAARIHRYRAVRSTCAYTAVAVVVFHPAEQSSRTDIAARPYFDNAVRRAAIDRRFMCRAYQPADIHGYIFRRGGKFYFIPGDAEIFHFGVRFSAHHRAEQSRAGKCPPCFGIFLRGALVRIDDKSVYGMTAPVEVPAERAIYDFPFRRGVTLAYRRPASAAQPDIRAEREIHIRRALALICQLRKISELGRARDDIRIFRRTAACGEPVRDAAVPDFAFTADGTYAVFVFVFGAAVRSAAYFAEMILTVIVVGMRDPAYRAEIVVIVNMMSRFVFVSADRTFMRGIVFVTERFRRHIALGAMMRLVILFMQARFAAHHAFAVYIIMIGGNKRTDRALVAVLEDMPFLLRLFFAYGANMILVIKMMRIAPLCIQMNVAAVFGYIFYRFSGESFVKIPFAFTVARMLQSRKHMLNVGYGICIGIIVFHLAFHIAQMIDDFIFYGCKHRVESNVSRKNVWQLDDCAVDRPAFELVMIALDRRRRRYRQLGKSGRASGQFRFSVHDESVIVNVYLI